MATRWRVAGEVLDHLSWRPERRPHVDDPIVVVERCEIGAESGGVVEIGELTTELELSIVEGSDEVVEELPSEHPCEHENRQEESGPTRDPTRAVGRQSSGRDEAVDVRMMLEGLSPGVQDGEETDRSAEVFRVRRDLAQGLGGGAEQDVVNAALVMESERADGRGEGEDDVGVRDGEGLFHPS